MSLASNPHRSVQFTDWNYTAAHETWFDDWTEAHEIDPPVVEKLRVKRLTTPHRLMVLNAKTEAGIMEFLRVDDTQAMLLKFALNTVTGCVKANYTQNSTADSSSSSTQVSAPGWVGNQPPDSDPVSIVEEERDSDALVEMLKLKHFRDTFDPERILAPLVIEDVLKIGLIRALQTAIEPSIIRVLYNSLSMEL